MKEPTIKSRRSTKRRQEIIQAAKKLFAEQGYHSTSTRSINQAIGAADGLLYHYFPRGKQQLLETIIQELLMSKMEQVRSLLTTIPAAIELEAFLYLAGRTILEHINRDPAVFALVLREKAVLPAAQREQLESFFTVLFDFLAARFQGYVQSGAIKPLAIEALTVQLISTFQHYIIMRLIVPGYMQHIDDEAYLRLAVEHMLSCWHPG